MYDQWYHESQDWTSDDDIETDDLPVVQVPIGAIVVVQRARAVDIDDDLLESIRRVGLAEPLLLERERERDGRLVLLDGRKRLVAIKRLIAGDDRVRDAETGMIDLARRLYRTVPARVIEFPRVSGR